MELQEQLEKIEQLKTDKYMRMLLLGIRSLGAIPELCGDVLEKHESTKNQTINKKLRAYWGDMLDGMDSIIDEFHNPACKEIGEFCGVEDYESFGDVIFEYSDGKKSFDEMIDGMKQYVINISKIPEGHVAIGFGTDDVKYMPEEEFDKWLESTTPTDIEDI